MPENESLKIVDIIYGNSKGLTIIKLENHASVISETLSLGNNNLKVKIIHKGKNSSSKIVSKNIVNNSTTFIAKTIIKEDATDSSTEQLIDSLMLSPNAKMNALPLIDIHNNEVIASHSTKIGTLDAEMLFFMRSRGLNCKEIKQAIIQGYINPFTELLSTGQKQTMEAIIK